MTDCKFCVFSVRFHLQRVFDKVIYVVLHIEILLMESSTRCMQFNMPTKIRLITIF